MDSGKIKFHDGNAFDAVGLGTWQSSKIEVADAVAAAIKAGVRHLDFAAVYGNQSHIAKPIKDSGVPREELFCVSKLWNSAHKPQDVEPALDYTLKELQLDYLDLYLIHWPVSFDSPAPTTELFPSDGEKDGVKTVKIDEKTSLVDTWKAMIALKKTGKVRSIGVSNFSTEMVDAIIEATGEVPVVNQVERHLRLPQKQLIEHHKKKNIVITAYSGFGNNSEGAPLQFTFDEVKQIAEKKGCTPAQVLIAWGTHHGQIAIIPKSVNEDRIKSNAKLVKLTKEEHDILDGLVDKYGEKRFNIPYNYTPRWDINVFDDASEKKAAHKVKIQ